MKKPHGIIALFIRDEHFYPIQFMGDEAPEVEAAHHAALNPGTRRIEDMDGNILWRETVQ